MNKKKMPEIQFDEDLNQAQIANFEEHSTQKNTHHKEFQQNWECKSTRVMNKKRMSQIQFDED
jgi:hypothetical protein